MNTRELYEIWTRRNFVILDTETTGLKRPAEICQIGIIDPDAATVLDTYVETRQPIPPVASAIHGITTDMVRGFPTWPVLKDSILRSIKGKDVLVYNATYDRHMMHCSDDMWELPTTEYKAESNWECVMLWYADVHGEWDEYHGNNRWQKLENAYFQCNGTPRKAHDAIQDCLMTYHVINHIMSDFDPDSLGI